MIPGFRRESDENFALLGYYAASGGNFLPTFRDNLSVPSSGFENPNPEWRSSHRLVRFSFTLRESVHLRRWVTCRYRVIDYKRSLTPFRNFFQKNVKWAKLNSVALVRERTIPTVCVCKLYRAYRRILKLKDYHLSYVICESCSSFCTRQNDVVSETEDLKLHHTSFDGIYYVTVAPLPRPHTH